MKRKMLRRHSVVLKETRNRADNKRNQRWPTAAMFVDGPEFVLVLAQLDTEGNILTKFKKKKKKKKIKKNPTYGLGGAAITRNVYRRTVGRTDGRRRVPRP